MRKNNGVFQSILLYTIFVFYLIIFLSIIIFKYVSPSELINADRAIFRSVNLIPLHTIKGYLLGTFEVSRSTSLKNVFGNIILFIPLGIYLQLFTKHKKILANLLGVFVISLSFEVVQYIFAIGASDIDDILLNCMGGLIGILLYKLMITLIKDDNKVRTTITIFSSIIGIPLFGLMILLFISNM